MLIRRHLNRRRQFDPDSDERMCGLIERVLRGIDLMGRGQWVSGFTERRVNGPFA